MNKTGQIILHLVVGVCSFLFFLVVLFPLDGVVGHVLADLEKRSQGKVRISTQSIDGSLLFDSEFSEVKVFYEGAEVFSAPTVYLNISLWSLLTNRFNGQLEAVYKNGSLEGKLDLSLSDPQDSLIDLEFNDVPAKPLSYLQQLLRDSKIRDIKTPITWDGTVKGSFYWRGGSKFVDHQMDLQLQLSGLKFEGCTITEIQMDVPSMVLSGRKDGVVIKANLDNSRLNLTAFELPGPDLKGSFKGDLMIDSRGQVQRLNFTGKIQLSAEIEEKLPLLATVATYKTADGAFPLTLGGTGSKPKISIGDIDLSASSEF